MSTKNKTVIVIPAKLQHQYRGGAFGTYFKLTNKYGVKVLSGDNTWLTKERAKKDWAYDEAREECDWIKSAEASGVTPKYARVVYVKYKWDSPDMYRIGILMEHMGDDTAYDLGYVDYVESEDEIEEQKMDQFFAIRDALKKTIEEKTGIYMADLHTKNIVKKGKQWFAIDFTPDLISFDETSKKAA